MSTSPLRLLHDFSSLKSWGGMLRVFANLAPRLKQLQARQYLFARTSGMSPMAQAVVESLAEGPSVDYRLGPVPLPRYPPVFRRWRRRRIAAEWNLNAILNWGRLGNYDALWLSDALGVPAFYWEHGAAWLRDRPLASGFLPAFDGVITVSHAARAMLEQRWGYRGEARVIHNAVWDEQRTGAEPAPVRRWNAGQPITLGFAGRMVSFKGAAVAIHTLAKLRQPSLPARLRLAGDGPDLDSLRGLARRLNVHDHVVFDGYVADMEAWYRSIDVLVHPALREPFGLICAEALCWGVPVVTVAVDGLPEVVENGVDGICVEPRLPLSEAGALGFAVGPVPGLVYHVGDETVGPPRIPDPADMAEAVLNLVTNGELEDVSRRAATGARQRFAIERQARALIGALVSRD